MSLALLHTTLDEALGESPATSSPAPRRRATPKAEERVSGLDVAALYRGYGDMVLGRCRTLLRNETDAQDACQEVFLKVHRYRDRFRHEAKPSTYLFRVTTTVCLNRIRSRSRRREDLRDEPTPVPVRDTYLDASELRDVLRRVLGEADEGTQACIIYHVVDGMTHQEIGDLLGLSAAAIRKRISTFKRRLAANPPPWIDELQP